MANTQTNSAAERRQLYEREIAFREMVTDSFFSQLMGKASGGGKESGKNSIVYVKTDLEAEQGEKITFYKKWLLEGNGVQDDQVLEGNEEPLNIKTDDVTLHLYRHAVIDAGALERKRAAYDIEKEMNESLKDWGTQKIDQLAFDALQDTPTTCFYNTTATGITAATGTNSYTTAKAAIKATESLLTPDLVRAMGSWALTGGPNGYYKIPPVMIDGKETYCLLVHPDCFFDLKTNADYEAFVRDAEMRGKTNPLFAGQDTIVIDGVVVKAHRRMKTFTDGGSGGNVPGAFAVLMGAGALCWAWGRRPYQTRDERDWGNRMGISWNVIAGVTKAQFKRLSADSYARDHASVGLVLSRTGLSDLG